MDKNINNTRPENYYEINLKELFSVLVKEKWIVIGVTSSFILLSILVSTFIIKPVYESTTVVAPASFNNLSYPYVTSYLVADDKGQKLVDSSKISDKLDQIVQLAQVDVSGLKEILTSNDVVEKTIKKMGLNENTEILKTKINVSQKTDASKVIQLSVRDGDPKRASNIANTLINEATGKINEINIEKMHNITQNLDEQLKTAQQNLSSIYNELDQYNRNNAANNYSEGERKKLEDELKRQQNIVDSLENKILEIKIAQSLSAVEDRITVLSSAIPPQNPIKPNKPLNIAVAGFLGLMVSVIICLRKDRFLSGNRQV